MKRTKRYGGFLIGDRVRVKDTAKTSCKGSGRVIAYNGPMLVVESYPMKGMIHEFAPRQLINLTRIEEEKKQEEYLDKLDKKIDELFSGEGEILISEFSYDPDNPKSPKEMSEETEAYWERVNTIWANFNIALMNRDFDTVNKMMKESFGVFGSNHPLYHLKDATDNLPSPYTRDVYSSSLDFML